MFSGHSKPVPVIYINMTHIGTKSNCLRRYWVPTLEFCRTQYEHSLWAMSSLPFFFWHRGKKAYLMEHEIGGCFFFLPSSWWVSSVESVCLINTSQTCRWQNFVALVLGLVFLSFRREIHIILPTEVKYRKTIKNF